MICEQCEKWAATSARQLKNRQRNMALVPSAEPMTCHKCGGTEWATTAMYIEPPRALVIPWYWETAIQAGAFATVFAVTCWWLLR